MDKKLGTMMVLSLLALVPASWGQAPEGVYGERLASRDDAASLPVFEIDHGFYTADVARERLSSVLALVAGREALTAQSSAGLAAATPESSPVWQGALADDPAVTFAFDRRSGRLEVRNERLSDPRSIPTTEAVSREKAVATALQAVSSLAAQRVVDEAELDLQDAKVSVQRSGIGQRGTFAVAAPREWVDNYRITFKRQIGGVPVVGSGLHVVVDGSGAVAEVGMAHRPVRAAVGLDAAPRVATLDVGAEEAKATFEKNLGLRADTRLEVERWGLAYLDTGSEAQRFYEPVWVFAATPLTETREGTIAGRKVVRVVPASRASLEEIPFDPTPRSAHPGSAGDVKPE